MAGSMLAAETQAVADVERQANQLGELIEHVDHPRVVQRVVVGLRGRNGYQGQAMILVYFSPLPEPGKRRGNLADRLLLVVPVGPVAPIHAFLEVGDELVGGREIPSLALGVLVGRVLAPEEALGVSGEIPVVRPFLLAHHRQAGRHVHA